MYVRRDGEIKWVLQNEGVYTYGRKVTDEFSFYMSRYYSCISISMWDPIDNPDEFFNYLKENDYVFELKHHYGVAERHKMEDGLHMKTEIRFYQIEGGDDIYSQFEKWYEKEG